MLFVIFFVFVFFNNMLVVVIFVFIIKCWVEFVCILVIKFLIFFLYVIILGGMCMFIGIFINLVVDGMILDVGYKGFGMFELGWVGIFIVLVGIVYLLFFFFRLLLEVWKDMVGDEYGEVDVFFFYCVEVVIGVCFLGINKRVGDFNFVCYYGVEVKEIK